MLSNHAEDEDETGYEHQPMTDTGAYPYPAGEDDLQVEEGEDFLRRLLRAWINERNAPELLPFQFQLIQDTIDLLHSQMERLEGELNRGTVELAFLRCLYQMDMDRVKYILQSYLRARLNKIEAYWYQLKGIPRDQQIRLMSKSEMDHLKRYQKLLEQGLQDAVLTTLPPQLRSLAHQDPDLAAMHPSPDTSSHVIARFREDVQEVLIDPVAQTVQQGVRAGDMYVLQYSAIKELLAKGTVELV